MTILKSHHLCSRGLVLSVVPKQVSKKVQVYLHKDAIWAFSNGARNTWTTEFALELLEESTYVN